MFVTVGCLVAFSCFFSVIHGVTETSRYYPRDKIGLVEFWPLHRAPRGGLENGRGIFNESNLLVAPGPFSNNGTALKENTGDVLFRMKSVFDNQFDFVTEMTLSFFIYLTPDSFNNNNNVTLFSIYTTSGYLSCLICTSITQNKLKTITASTSGNFHSLQTDYAFGDRAAWHFFAFTANELSLSTYHYELGSSDTEPVHFGSRLIPDGRKSVLAMGQSLNIGKDNFTNGILTAENSMACVLLYATQLTSMEIKQLPTLCSSLATEQIQSPNVPQLGNLLFFSPFSSSNESMAVENAFFLPRSCDVIECTDSGIPGQMTPYGFPALSVEDGKFLGTYEPFRQAETGSWTIGFYLNNIEPNISRRLFMTSNGDHELWTEVVDSKLSFKNGICSAFART